MNSVLVVRRNSQNGIIIVMASAKRYSRIDNDIERSVLIEFYESSSGEKWNKKFNWRSDEPLDEWYGVNVLDEEHVTKIKLDNNSLIGQIPESFCKLSQLTLLSLSNNQLSGHIPHSLGSLLQLSELRLDGNQLTGSIPESLGNLKNLTRLSLEKNQLKGAIPISFGNLANVTVLSLNENQLTGE